MHWNKKFCSKLLLIADLISARDIQGPLLGTGSTQSMVEVPGLEGLTVWWGLGGCVQITGLWETPSLSQLLRKCWGEDKMSDCLESLGKAGEGCRKGVEWVNGMGPHYQGLFKPSHRMGLVLVQWEWQFWEENWHYLFRFVACKRWDGSRV